MEDDCTTNWANREWERKKESEIRTQNSRFSRAAHGEWQSERPHHNDYDVWVISMIEFEMEEIDALHVWALIYVCNCLSLSSLFFNGRI